ncbi:hypothetical protein CBR_g6677 [Chara braunii]|uniref:Uncharacterized protein n=1 Tax=Chara braunii TaxID=69332 RepID=A0A388KKG7_CHABU|nr:hypothetical protein CBR_g6677 [Chara braunii]|eukprot:GBG70551.1 hypothetical protein CBR_g6677 [Chara braunii]
MSVISVWRAAHDVTCSETVMSAYRGRLRQFVILLLDYFAGGNLADLRALLESTDSIFLTFLRCAVCHWIREAINCYGACFRPSARTSVRLQRADAAGMFIEATAIVR